MENATRKRRARGGSELRSGPSVGQPIIALGRRIVKLGHDARRLPRRWKWVRRVKRSGRLSRRSFAKIVRRVRGKAEPMLQLRAAGERLVTVLGAGMSRVLIALDIPKRSEFEALRRKVVALEKSSGSVRANGREVRGSGKKDRAGGGDGRTREEDVRANGSDVRVTRPPILA